MVLRGQVHDRAARDGKAAEVIKSQKAVETVSFV